MITYIGPCDEVLYMSQYDTGIESWWHQRYCGIVSLYMVVDYWYRKLGKATPSLGEISEYALGIDGFDMQGGWIHTKLAATARHFGCSAIVRSWFARDSDLDIMQNQGRLKSKREILRYSKQVKSEFMYTLSGLLADDMPVILSVKPRFGPNGTNHLIVVTGIDRDLKHVLLHDPQYHKGEGEHMSITTERLLQFCNFNAILVYDETVRS